MAQLYPERLPQSVLNEPRRAAERKVYRALSTLPDDFTVFYSVAWQVRSVRSGARDGEADFVIAHPELGVMILEVKGGGVHYAAEQQQWFSVDRNGVEHPIKDPVDQARKSKGALLEKLRDLPAWDGRFLTVAYMVVFPDILIEKGFSLPHLPRTLIVDHANLDEIAQKIQSGFKWFFGADKRSGALGVRRLRILEKLLGRSFAFRTPLGVELAEEDERLIELTELQYGVLRYFQRYRRAVIEGCAGSGKTMLALEKARQLAGEGFDTLLVCFNVPLANYLRQRLPEDVDVFHFHGLCRQLVREAGIGHRVSKNERDFYDNVLPSMLLDAISELGPQYDAIIVDEGQDFRDEWWEYLFFLLRDEQGIFYVFYDSNQNIYHRSTGLRRLIEQPPITLWENCRNTQAIHNVVRQFYHDPLTLNCQGPAGRKPEVFFFQDEQQQESVVRKILHRLVHEEKVSPQHIVILTTRAPRKTPFSPGRKLGNFQLAEWADDVGWRQEIRVSSVHRFKGLESRVIILAGLEGRDMEWLKPLLYVATSRARTHLVVVAHENAKAWLQTMLA